MRQEASKTLFDFLTKRGYRPGSPSEDRPDHVVAVFYRIDRAAIVPKCLCNNKPPQFVISESYFNVGGDTLRPITIGIKNEAPQGWVDFKFYALLENELIERIDEIEAALMDAWSVLFKRDEQ